MGNCVSDSSNVERDFAEQQRRRAMGQTEQQPGATSAYAPSPGAGPSPAFAQMPAGNGMPAPPQARFDPKTGKPLNVPQHPAAPQPSQPQENENVIRGDGQIGRRAGELLVISYDIGTTASGCAYTYRDSSGRIGFGPEVIDQWPGQTGTSVGKTPSVLFYDGNGTCQAEWGAQCLAPQWSTARLQSSGLRKVEWFKLHVEKEGVPAEHFNGDSRQLPHGVTVWQVYGDYLQRLHAAAVARFRSRRGSDLFDRLTAAGRVQYILTVPAAWQRPAIVGELRRCARRAGLVTDEESVMLDFCAEPEASALECYNAAEHLAISSGDVFSVVDAGGGTVDFTTYQVQTLTPLTMKEVDVGSARCLYRGGTFVDRSFEEMLHSKLQRDYADTYQERHLLRGMKEFVNSVKLQFSETNRSPTYLQLSDSDEFNQGCVLLNWDEIAECFRPHVDEILRVARAQMVTPAGRSKVIFCSGGFGSNDYLRQRLAADLNVQVLQPGDKSAGSKAVSLGATRYGIDHSVQSRTAAAWYGVKAFVQMGPQQRAQPGAQAHAAIGKSGREILSDTFAVVLPMGSDVTDDEWRTSKFNMELTEGVEKARQGKLLLYSATNKTQPMYVDEAGVTFVCQVDVWIPPRCEGRLMTSNTGERYRVYAIVVLLSLGRAEIKTRVMIDGIEAGGAKISWK